MTVGERGDLVAAQIDLLQRLGAAHPELRSVTQGLVLLREALADRRCLLVVDDVWSVAAAAAFRAVGPRGRVLYTTRDPAVLEGVGAAIQRIDVLPPEAARELLRFLTRVQALPLRRSGSSRRPDGWRSRSRSSARDRRGRAELAAGSRGARPRRRNLPRPSLRRHLQGDAGRGHRPGRRRRAGVSDPRRLPRGHDGPGPRRQAAVVTPVRRLRGADAGAAGEARLPQTAHDPARRRQLLTTSSASSSCCTPAI